jgi:hypothetical protein
MKRLRRTLAPTAATWLFLQVAAVAAVQAVLWTTPVAADLVRCTCVHGAEEVCPMHHEPASNPDICLLRSGTDGGTAILTLILSNVGLLPADAAAPPPASALLDGVVSGIVESIRPIPPDPPPPRA